MPEDEVLLARQALRSAYDAVVSGARGMGRGGRAAHATISSLLTARKESWPEALVRPLSRPTPSRKLSAFWRAAASGTTASACFAVSSWTDNQHCEQAGRRRRTFLGAASAAWCRRLSTSFGGRLLIAESAHKKSPPLSEGCGPHT